MPIDKERFISEVAAVHDSYKPSEVVVERLHGIDLTTVSAPTGMGKDTLIARSGVPRVLAETIREPRVNSGVMEQNGVEYEFRGAELDVVLEELQRGEHVQIGMGPGRNSFYGSRIANYPPGGPALIDVMTSQVDTMRQLPFLSVESVMITTPSYEEWQQRLRTRGQLSSSEWTARHAEARQSLQDGLEDDRFVFILNDEVAIAASALRSFAESRDYSRQLEVRARNVARAILARISEH